MAGNQTSNATHARQATATAAAAKAAAGTKSTLGTATVLSRELARRNETSRRQQPRSDRFDDDDLHARDEEPDLGFEEGDDPWEEDREQDQIRFNRPPPAIRLWRNEASVEYEVGEISSELLADPLLAPHALKRARRLDAYARTLASHLAVADIDAPLNELWDSLPVLSQASFAAQLTNMRGAVGEQLTHDTVSRDRDVLVALPGATVALGLLLSKTVNDAAVQLIAQVLLEDPTVSRVELDRRVAGAGRGKRKAELYLGWVQLALAHPASSAQFRAALLATPERYDSLIDDYADWLRTAPKVDLPGRHEYAPYPGRHDAPLFRAIVGGFR